MSANRRPRAAERRRPAAIVGLIASGGEVRTPARVNVRGSETCGKPGVISASLPTVPAAHVRTIRSAYALGRKKPASAEPGGLSIVHCTTRPEGHGDGTREAIDLGHQIDADTLTTSACISIGQGDVPGKKKPAAARPGGLKFVGSRV